MASGFAFGDVELQNWANDEGARVVEDTGYYLHLYKNNYSPVPGLVPGDFVEADYVGYAAQNVIPPSYTIAIVDDVAIVTWPDLYTFVPISFLTPPQDIYGYYVTDGDGNIAWAEAFPAVTPIQESLPIYIILRIKLKNCAE